MSRQLVEVVFPVMAMLLLGVAIGAGLGALITWSFACAMVALPALVLAVICTFSMWLMSV